ncbi:conserved hypothetical protein [Anaeromyxobacter dehalogenans 2CP-1]|uniref:Lipoprotein n=1 Tax=Anaeromyxobacter dehalogenans (strain ATCC BAA-258 / DSM 21875 / 2CP-1) TaxID=455488 RepID=B8J6E7_ANAD2|nr:hypothetical protein [Anaeromyxobacter dehalogenans]ACL65128.1 conserved hypothetical protein [Anaeromyxobacter dehalogenans 2CP-1]
MLLASRPAIGLVVLLSAAAGLAACSSSAPYTLGAAAVNTSLALGVAAGQRASGGCYATCTGGTVCNPVNGMCEAAAAEQVCQEAPGGGMRCVPVSVRGMTREKDGSGQVPPVRAGVSPATGTVAPPPNEASPRTAP